MRGVGADYAQGSGDYAIAFSVHDPALGGPVADDLLSPLFAATMDAVEEALINSVLAAETTVGPDGRTARAVPIDEVRARLARAGPSDPRAQPWTHPASALRMPSPIVRIAASTGPRPSAPRVPVRSTA